MRLYLQRVCGALLIVLAEPALAGPNVFWTFGFERPYLHATGGRAELPQPVELALAKQGGQATDDRTKSASHNARNQILTAASLAKAR